jgi:hypothetical protein
LEQAKRSSLLQLRTDAVAWRSVEGEVVALDLRQSEYLVFNATGEVLWKALAEGETSDGLVARVLRVFDVDPVTATVDVAAFVADLQERGLVWHVEQTP